MSSTAVSPGARHRVPSALRVERSRCRALLLHVLRGRSFKVSSATRARQHQTVKCAEAGGSSSDPETSATLPKLDPEQSQLLAVACAVGLLTGAAVSGTHRVLIFRFQCFHEATFIFSNSSCAHD